MTSENDKFRSAPAGLGESHFNQSRTCLAALGRGVVASATGEASKFLHLGQGPGLYPPFTQPLTDDIRQPLQLCDTATLRRCDTETPSRSPLNTIPIIRSPWHIVDLEMNW